MKVEEIIEKLCNHEISKTDAIKQIKSITNRLRLNGALEFEVEEVGFVGSHGYLKLILPYRYDKMKDKVSKGDKIDVMFLP